MLHTVLAKKYPHLIPICFFVLLGHLALFFFPFKETKKEKPPLRRLPVYTYELPPPPPIQVKKVKRKGQTRRSTSQKAQGKKETLQKVRKALAKIAPLKSKIEGDLKVDIPKPLSALHIDAKQNAKTDPLIAYLRENLKLPEYGSVTLKITFCGGKIKEMKLVQSESEVNLAYLKKTLPLLSFPLKETTEGKTWVLTFCNET